MEGNFRKKVYEIVAQIPCGRVMTYGDIAAVCGQAHAARVVGGIAHFGDPDLPWQRVVNRFGGLASGYYGGRKQQQIDLEQEGVQVRDFRVIDFNKLRWSPFVTQSRAKQSSKNGVASGDTTCHPKLDSGSRLLPIVAIVGPTASGKTALAIELAKEFNGEIICTDSRTIYRGMDIGTAKPTEAEQDQVKHWGLDLVNPDEKFTVADYKQYAEAKIAEIRARGKIPFLVGGSGLYFDSVMFDYQFSNVANEKLRAELSQMTVDELQNYCKDNNISLPENSKNRRYLMRAIERGDAAPNSRAKIRDDAVIVGILTDREVLRQRIAKRVRLMFDGDIEEEMQKLFAQYAPDFDGSPASFAKLPEALKSNIYQFVWREMHGEVSRDKAIELAAIDDWHLAKKQLTWFRRNPAIKWLPSDEIEEYLHSSILSS